MDTHLAKSSSGYLVGDRVTIADISCWGWVASHSKFLFWFHPDGHDMTDHARIEWAGVDIAEFPNLEKWLYNLLERPGFEAGRNVPTPHTASEHKNMTEEELEAKAAGARNWVQAGMKVDSKK